MDSKIKKPALHTILKVFIRIFSLVIVFIISSLIIWSFHMKGITNYTQLLNEKDWSETISHITATDPASIFSMFYVGSDNLQSNNNSNINIDIDDNIEIIDTNIEVNQDTTDTGDTIDIDTGNSLDPYDPKFEEDFNSFFGGEESELNDYTGDIVENNEIVGFDTSGEIKKEHAVAEALIKKFNE